jgi:drug/metabolite transporter (DMT)-like permease
MDVVGVLLAFGAAVSFSLMNLAIRTGGRAHPAGDAVLPTLVVTTATMTVLFVVAGASGRLLATRPDAILWFIAIGLTGAFLGRTFLFAGIRRIGVVRASAIKNGAPVVTLLIAILLLGERFTLVGSLGIALILVGVLLVVRESLSGFMVLEPAEAVIPAPLGLSGPEEARPASAGQAVAGQPRLLGGVALAAIAAAWYGASNALSKVGMNVVPDGIQAGAVGAWAALAGFLILAAARGQLAAAALAILAPRPWFWLAGVLGTLGQLCFFSAVQLAPVGPVTVVAASEVVLTTMLGGLLVQRTEQVNRRIAIPAVLVFIGAALIALRR